jgi:hypothetical protein
MSRSISIIKSFRTWTKNLFHPLFQIFQDKNNFFAIGMSFYSRKSCFFQYFLCFGNWYRIFSWMALTSLIKQFQRNLYVQYLSTFFLLWDLAKKKNSDFFSEDCAQIFWVFFFFNRTYRLFLNTVHCYNLLEDYCNTNT